MKFSHTLITGGTFTQNQKIDNNFYGKSGFQRLQEAAAPAAFHNSNERFDPPKCYPNTRVAVLQKIMDWILGRDPGTRDTFIMWLYGAAGAGKSAIAQTIAELCHAERVLLASFFFSRSDSTRNHEHSFIATIAYQLCMHFPELQEHLNTTIERDPLIFTRSLSAQITSLIVEPIEPLLAAGFFKRPESRRLIIVDGLDECEIRQNQRVRVQIIDIFVQAVRQHKLPFIVLFCSRPEHDISSKFSSHPTSEVSRLALDDRYEPDNDIRLLFGETFKTIATSHPFSKYIPEFWPSEEVISQLIEKASGQFIYASMAIKFVESIDHLPTKRLEIVLGLRPAQRDMPFAELDELYTEIFSSLSPDDLDIVLNILGLVILTPDDELPLYFIQRFFSLDDGDIHRCFRGIRSLIELSTNDDWLDVARRGNEYIYLFHASTAEFLLDESRSNDLYLDPPKRHAEYVHICLRHLKAQSPISYQSYQYDGELSCLFEHLRGAPYTAIRSDFLEFVDSELSPSRKENGEREFLTSFLPDILSCIEQEHFRETEAYTHVLRLIDNILIQEIPVYYTDNRLTFLAAMTGNFKFSKRIALFPEIKASMKLFQLDDDDIALKRDNSALYLHWVEFDAKWEAGRYPKFISDFLRDPTRAGEYTLNGQRYAVAALCCLRYLCNYETGKPVKYNSRERSMRRKTPWLWRNQIICYGTHFMDQKKIAKITARKRRMASGFNYWLDLISPEHPAIQPFVWGLEALPFLLDQAGKLEELIEFASRRGFPKVALSLPRRTKRARKAISNYLARVLEEQ